VFYLSAMGELWMLLGREHTEANLEAMFGGDLNWLIQAFPATKKGDYSVKELRSWLYAQAKQKGFFDPDRNLRGPGAWLDGRNRLILHCGDAVLIDGVWRPSGFDLDGIVYTRAPAEARPAPDAAPAAAGRELLGFMEMWNWCSPSIGTYRLASMLAVGWLGCAFITGALHWRPHILITGARGTGKTYLNTLMEYVLGADAVYKASAPSAAGIRQALAGAARPVMLDEIEHDPDNHRAKDLVELARLGSSDGQGAVVRGTAEGRAQVWAIRACFCFSAIDHPALKPQDASRITVLELDPLPRDSEAAALARERIQAFGDVGPALRARMLAGFDRLALNLEVYAQALSATGADGRQCDQFGSLLGAADVLTDDNVTSVDKAERIAKLIMGSAYIPSEEEEGHGECLNHLLSTATELPLGVNNVRLRRTLGEIVRYQLRRPTREKQRTLATYGLMVRETTAGRYLVVANQHRGLAQIFASTRWQGGVWRQALARMPLCLRPNSTLRFAGAVSRAIWIPETALPPLDDDDDQDAFASGEAAAPTSGEEEM
ncbi:MAG: hypothetical protein ACTSWM_00875, partial [Alphaproteobacteria bacterium]